MSEQALVRIEKALEKLDGRLDSVDVTLVAQHTSLKDHIRRTELLEKSMDSVQKHVTGVQAVMRFIGGAGIIASFVELVSFFTSR